MPFHSLLISAALLSATLLFNENTSYTSADELATDSNCPEIAAIIKGGDMPLETTFLFIDKSVSLNTANAFVLNKYQDINKQLFKQHIHQAGDRLVVYQVHHSTLTGEEFDYTFSTSLDPLLELNGVCNKADKVINSLKNQYQSELFTQTNAKRKSIIRILTDATGAAGYQTDLWGSLQVISDKNPKTPIINAYYFSDMVESMKGANRRDLHLHHPENLSEANLLATEDLKRIKKVCAIKPSILKKLHLTIVLPHAPSAPPLVSKPYVKAYWQKLLAGLGVTDITFV